MTADPHKDQAVLQAGAPVAEAEGAIVFLHGRGGSAAEILTLAADLAGPGMAYFAPQAAGHTWYPYSFLAPRQQNEPYLSSALRKVEAVVKVATDAGIGAERIVICGFSQGACLATEFVASHPKRYAGLIAYTGGLIGPPGMEMNRQGDLAGTPVFMGSGDSDAHVPWLRVQESAEALKAMGAMVTARRYPGRAHTISSDEIKAGRHLIEQAFLPLPIK